MSEYLLYYVVPKAIELELKRAEVREQEAQDREQELNSQLLQVT